MRLFLQVPAGLLTFTLLMTAVGQDTKPAAKTGFTICKETTYFTSPVNKDGYIDYLAAINEKMKAGVTPENNALIPLIQAIGPKPEGSRLHGDFYQLLGVPEPPEAGEFLIDLTTYARTHKLIKDDRTESEWIDEWTDRLTKRQWQKQEYPSLSKWVEVNAKPLSFVQKATERNRYYVPYIAKTFGKGDDYAHTSSFMTVLLPTIQTSRTMANVLMARAMRSAGEKNYDAAWTDLHLGLQLGRVVSKGITIIELLIGLAINDVTVETTLAVLDDPQCPTSVLRRMQQDIEQLQPMGGLAERFDLGERCMGLEALQLVHHYGLKYLEILGGGGKSLSGPMKPSTSLHKANWDPSFKKVNAHYDRLSKALNEKDASVRRRELSNVEDDMKRLRVAVGNAYSSPLRLFYAPQKQVELLTDASLVLLTPAQLKVQQASEKSIQRMRSLQLAIALALHHRDKKTYPATLAELSPTYLNTMPLDYFSDQPMIYQKTDTGYRFYSVGPNGKDDGGVTRQEKPGCDDLVVTLPLPALKPE